MQRGPTSVGFPETATERAQTSCLSMGRRSLMRSDTHIIS
jgi:hypothetical protein